MLTDSALSIRIAETATAGRTLEQAVAETGVTGIPVVEQHISYPTDNPLWNALRPRSRTPSPAR